jgi:hypothetical protein
MSALSMNCLIPDWMDSIISRLEKLLQQPNTDGWGNKLITVFARYLDCFILTNNFSFIYQIRDFGSGQIMKPRQSYLSPSHAKIAPWWLARRDNFPAKVPGLCPDASSSNAYIIIPPGRQTV